MQTFGGTVGQVVKSADVDLKSADRVSPAVDASVHNGTVINVNQAKEVKVSLDGAEKTVSTTAQDVAGLVTELGVASTSSVSVPKDAQLARRRLLRVHLHPQDRQHRRGRQGGHHHHHGAPPLATSSTDAGLTLGANDRHLPAGQRARRQQHGDQGLPR